MKATRAFLLLLLSSASWLAAQDATPPPTPPPAPPAAETPPPPPVEVPAPPPPAPVVAPEATTPPPPPPAAGPEAVQIVAPVAPTVTPGTTTTTTQTFVPSNNGPDQIKSVTTSAPSLDIKFPGGNGTATLQFQAPATTPTTAAQPDEVISLVDFPDLDIRTILRQVADMFQLNLVIPDTLTGTATVKLRNVTWRQVFQVVLEPVGFTYVEDNNIIKIKSHQELATEPVETKVFLINSSKASEMVNSLSPLIDAGAGGRIQVDNRTNALVITERPSHMNNIQEIIERLDRPTQQVSIETKFVELNLNDAGNLGVTWNFDGSSLLAAGTAWQYSIAQGLGSVVGSQPYGTPIPPPPAGAAQLPGPRRAADLAFFNTQQYNAVLRALETDQRARLVSNPTVVTLDNEEIFIHVGETIPIVYPTINNQTGNTTPGEREKIDTGVKLRVKPQVSNNGFINLTLNPEISRVSRSINYFGGDYPVIETRKLTDAKVSIKDGFTLALGGLIDDSDIKNITKTPILGDIPIIGELFTERDTQHNRRNLIIFLTAKTLNPDGATFRDVINPNLMLRTDITDEEVPGYYDRSHPNVPGVPRATPDQLKAMQDASDARTKAIYDKQMKEIQQMTKEAKSGEATHLGKGQ